MKKIVLTIFSVVMIFSCSVDPELNVDQKNPPTVSGATLFTNGTRNLFDLMQSCSVNNNVFRLYSQYWAQTTYPDESQYNQVTRNLSGSYWNTIYRDVLKDLDGAKISVESSVDNPNKEDQLAAIEFITVYAYSFLVDVFGNIPYTEALDSNNPTPKYDDAETIYLDLLKRLDAAVDNMTIDGQLGFTDIVYNGEMGLWKKAANSLLLRMSMRIADKKPAESKTYAEKAFARPLIENNSENFAIKYYSASPNTNPLWVSLVQSGRNDFVPANTLVDIMQARTYETKSPGVDMNGDDKVDEKDDYTVITPGSFQYTDPRSSIYFENDDPKNYPIPDTLVIKDAAKNIVETLYYTYNSKQSRYKGGTYGSANSYPSATHLGAVLSKANLEGTIISASEVSFLLAEAAARPTPTYTGVPNATVEANYNKGITDSFLEWGLLETDAIVYLTANHVAYATAAGDWKQKIGTQKWIALFNNGFEGWNTWKIFSKPDLNAPAGLTLDDIPTRFIYPLSEATLNGEQYSAAAAAIGGDTKTNKIFWDVN